MPYQVRTQLLEIANYKQEKAEYQETNMVL